MPRRSPEPVMLTVAEAAARLGVSEQRVRTLIAQGRIPARKHGLRTWSLQPRDVADFEKNGRYTGRAGGKPPPVEVRSNPKKARRGVIELQPQQEPSLAATG